MKTLAFFALITIVLLFAFKTVSAEHFHFYQQIFHLKLDYRNVGELVKAGKYDWVHPDINAEHFHIALDKQKEVDVFLIYFRGTKETETIFRDLGEIGLKPAGIRELLVFGEKYPDIQREITVVALDINKECYPALYGDRSHRELYLICKNNNWWNDFYWFITIQKQSPSN